MLTIQSKLQSVKNALLAVSDRVYHYTAPTNAKVPYIVWYEESEGGSLEANNHKAEQAVYGWVELFTQTEFDPLFDSVQNALNSVEGLAWTWNDTSYGDPARDDDKVIHSSWSWSHG